MSEMPLFHKSVGTCHVAMLVLYRGISLISNRIHLRTAFGPYAFA